MFNLKNHLGVQLQLQGEGIPSYSVQHFFRQLMLFLLLPHSSKVVELPLLIHFDTLAQAAAA